MSVQNEDSQARKPQAEKFPTNLDNLTEEEKKKWFRWEEIAGGKILKVRRELLPPPKAEEGEPIFFVESTTYEKITL